MGLPFTVATTTSPGAGTGSKAAGGPTVAGGADEDPHAATTRSTRFSARRISVALHEGEPRHLFADGDHGHADHHHEQRGHVIAPCQVIERLLEEEQAAADQRDGEDLEEVASHVMCLIKTSAAIAPSASATAA